MSQLINKTNVPVTLSHPRERCRGGTALQKAQSADSPGGSKKRKWGEEGRRRVVKAVDRKAKAMYRS